MMTKTSLKEFTRIESKYSKLAELTADHWDVFTEDKLPSLKLQNGAETTLKKFLTVKEEFMGRLVWFYKKKPGKSASFHFLLVRAKSSNEPKDTREKEALNKEITLKSQDILKSQSVAGMSENDFSWTEMPSVEVHTARQLSAKGNNSVQQSAQANTEIMRIRATILDAVKIGASDVHVESDGTEAKLFFRIHKRKIFINKMTHQDAVLFGTTCHTGFNAGSDISNDGSFVPTNHNEGEFEVADVRGRLLSLFHGQGVRFNIVVRLITKKKKSAQNFEDLGMSDYVVSSLSKLEKIKSGMILICGVTGSGKSTTLQNMLRIEVRNCAGERNIYSLEDPVEAIIEGVNQISVNGDDDKEDRKENASMDSEVINKKLMRGDPDSIAYGEIRDTKSAKSAYKGVDSGHLAYGTLHVRSALAAFGRLNHFGLPYEDICTPGFMQIIMHQTLVPKVCPHCSIKYNPFDKNSVVPQRFSETFVLKNEIPAERLKSLAIEQSKTGRNPFRLLQDSRDINAAKVYEYQKKFNDLNSNSSTSGLKNRLQKLLSKTPINPSEVNISFIGSGCEHCYMGTVGVTPAIEIVIPDETLLHLIKTRQEDRAALYYRSSMGGRSPLEDLTMRILTGVVDPWMAEDETQDYIASSF